MSPGTPSRWEIYRPGEVTPGMEVVTGEDEPWVGKSSAVRVEKVVKVTRFFVVTTRGVYWRRTGRQRKIQPLPHPRRILYRALAD